MTAADFEALEYATRAAICEGRTPWELPEVIKSAARSIGVALTTVEARDIARTQAPGC
jgi:hypothetical protein